jgi:opacity protein-like surface antigen
MDVKDKLKDDRDLPGNQVLTESGDIELKAWIVTPTVGYVVHNSEKARVEVLGGLRYLWLDAGVKFALDGEPEVNVSDSGSSWDAIVGLRTDINLNEKWYLPVYFDIGTGNSKSTWQAFAGVGYRFSKVDAILAYRYLDYDFDDSPVFDDMVLKGVFAGFSFRF